MATGLADAVAKAGADDPLRGAGDAHPARRRRRGAAASSSAAASGSPPTSSSATPTCRSPTARCSAASTRRASPAAAGTRRRACCGSPACAGAPPADAAHHNIHFGRQWDESFDAIIHRRRADGRPVDPRDAALARRPVAGARRLLDALRPRAGAEPRRPGRLDARIATPRSARLRQQVAAAGYPVDVVTEEIYDPLDWEAQGMERGTPFALAHTFRQTGPFRPAQRRPAGARPRVRRVVDRARRRRADGAGVGQAGRGPRPARWGGRDGHARGQLRRVPAAEQAPRHDVLLVDGAAAVGQAPPRPRPVRVLPLRRRHRRRPRAGVGAPTRAAALRDVRRPLLRRPRAGVVRRPRAEGGRPHGAGVRHRSRRLPPLPALDDDGPHRRVATRPTTTCATTWTARRR